MYSRKVIQAINEISEQDIKESANMLVECRNRGGKVLLAGNGGSSAICSHFAQDLIKCLGIAAINLTDNVPVITAYSNDEHYDLALGELADVLVGKNDMFFLMTTSGKSKNILHLAFRFKNPAVALVGNEGGDMSKWHKHINYVYAKGFDARSNEDVFSVICHAIIDDIQNRP